MLLKERERMSQETISLELSKRETVGKRLRALRDSGQVPAVIHDHGKPSVITQAEYNTLAKVVNAAGKNHIVALTVEKDSYSALIKDVSLHPKKGTITHVVFNAVKADEKVDAEVPIEIRYAEGDDATPAERAGLIVLHNVETVEIESLPKDIPEALYFAAEKLVAAGDQVTVADLEVPKGVTVKEDETQVLATVFEPSALAAANDAAGGDAEAGDEANVVSQEGGEATEVTTES